MKRRTKAITIITIAVFGLLMSKNFLHRTDASIYTATITGNTTLAGTDILYDGLISPGYSPGKITVSGNFTMGSSATYKCELKDLSGAGTGHDQIVVMGAGAVPGDVSLNGTLEIVLLDGFSPMDDDAFEIMAFTGSLNGTIFTNNTGMPSGWKIDYGALVSGKITIYGPNAPAPLPVELLNFRVLEKSDMLVLSWETASEQNSDYFGIEHSVDAMNFADIGRQAAGGMSNSLYNYAFTHNNPSRGINYYRLKQVDLDGTFTYSNIISAVLGKDALAFYPNPATQTITFDEVVEKVIIYDLIGRAILRNEQPVSVIDVSGLIPGIYILDVNSGEFKERLVIK